MAQSIGTNFHVMCSALDTENPFKVTAYVTVPKYKDKSDGKWSTKYAVAEHKKVLKKWRTDLSKPEYSQSQTKRNIYVGKLSAFEAFDEYINLYSVEELTCIRDECKTESHLQNLKKRLGKKA
eukprot:243279_1